MSGNNCFVCTGEIQSRNSSDKENSTVLLFKILEMPHLGNSKKFRINYCVNCMDRILSIRDTLEELERLEKKVLDEKYLIEVQLKENFKNHSSSSHLNFSNDIDQLKHDIVTELRSTSVESMLKKIRKKRVGRKLCTQKQSEIMGSGEIPNISGSSAEGHHQSQNITEGNMFVSRESSSLESNPQEFVLPQRFNVEDPSSRSQPTSSCVVENDDRQIQIPSVPDTHYWRSEIDECDIKLEQDTEQLGVFVDVDHFDLTVAELNCTQHDNFYDLNLNVLGTNLTEQIVTDQVEEVKFSQPHGEGAHKNRENHNRLQGKNGGSSKKSSTADPKTNPENPMLHKIHTNVKAERADTSKMCDECGKVLSSNTTLKEHVNSIHRGQYKFKCSDCSYGCQNAKDMRKHTMRMHSGNKNFKCPSCYKSSKSLNALNKHISRRHPVKQ